MKWIHTADWHLGKLLQGVYMTEDQRFALLQLIDAIIAEQPDAVIIAGDLYDRSVPPTEAVELLNEILERIVIELNTPVLAVSGNHDSADRLEFASRIMETRGLHLVGQLRARSEPVVLKDDFGEVHFHLVPYADPSRVRYVLQDDSIRTHDDAMKAIVAKIKESMDPDARHVFVGHAFVTPSGEAKENTSDSERPLSVGGAEYVQAEHFHPFHYTALGHLHQAHYVLHDRIRYAGSPLKYSISEEHHQKGFYVVEMDESGNVQIEKRLIKPLRDVRRVVASLEELETHEGSEDYVFVTLLNDHPVLFPMEKVRAIYPNALHVERKVRRTLQSGEDGEEAMQRATRQQTDPVELFTAFYQEVKGIPLDEEKKRMFAETWNEVFSEEGGA